MPQTSQTRPRPPRLPGDPRLKTQLEQIIRVDHSGEYGAIRIYEGQSSVIRTGEAAEAIREMAAQEAPHLAYFNTALTEKQIRPSALLPLWHLGGWLMGAVTAKLGEKSAMACTVAVETVINEHYQEQADYLEAQNKEPDLKASIEQFAREEMEHHDTALNHGAEDASAYPVLSFINKAVTRCAIFLAKRI